MKSIKRLIAFFYRTETGNEPVKEWLMKLEKEDRRLIGIAIKDTEYAWPIGLPLCRKLAGTNGLYEVRCNITDNRISRVIFYIQNEQMILLHGFIKKTQKTEQKEIDLAIKRLKQFMKG